MGLYAWAVRDGDVNTFCKGLADYDSDVDGTDAAMFKSHFGRSVFKNPCPPDGPAPVMWSGQMTSYATGDDGDLERGVHWAVPRFKDNGDGTLTDKATGLIWLRNANCFGTRTWNQALSDCNGLSSGQCGLTDGSQPGDWRLPSIRELRSVFDYSQQNPAIGFFVLLLIQNLQIDHYWTSTTNIVETTYAFASHTYSGNDVIGYKLNPYYVWPVRGGH